MAFYAFFKVEKKCGGIMVDHGLEASSQPKIVRIQIGDLGGQVEGKCRLMILSSPKWGRSICFTQRAICGGAPSSINTVVVSHRLT
ncbi:hypothetical protein TNCV_907071 [Trichonephila clavipes]|nr:hypothetical protein TNCV_907071 [Trichonephila clavipes]